ncbi:superinfection immunity protein [Microbulbifer sp. TYP-18]|uniref:superinfection immunity protein n=1 Tax=Microbulbifer sp. TYP-18 TaxID=3230024 RepID=UPI0034C641D4
MFTDFDQTLAAFTEAFRQMNWVQVLMFTLFFLVVWFLPAIVALFCNRRHLGKIFIANIPAIASWVVWFGLLAWAATGRLTQKKIAEEP